MAEVVDLGTRRISGTGQIIIEPEDLNYRRYTLYADIIRKQKTPYFNRNYEPPQTFYGYISLMKQGYLLQTLSIKYDAQVWIFDADISGQNLVAIKCAYLGTLETFFNLGNSLNLPSLSVENTIAEYKYLPLPWDNIIIKCDNDCAIQFNLSALPYDVCEAGYQVPADNPSPPTKPTPVLPGVGTNISPAYPSNDIITDPAQIDKSVNNNGTWLLTWTTQAAGTASGTYPGKGSDTFELVSPSPACALSGSSTLIRRPDNIVMESVFNCNNDGFVSQILSATFTATP